MKQYLSLALLCIAGMLVHASDKNNNKQKSLKEQKTWLGNLCAKKYTLNQSSDSSGYESFSSKSHFIVCEFHSSGKNIFNRNSGLHKKIISYNRYAAESGDTYREIPSYSKSTKQNLRNLSRFAPITILQDSHIALGEWYSDGVTIDSLDNPEEGVKQIALPQIADDVVTIPEYHTIDELYGMGKEENNLLGRAYYAGVFIVDVSAEKVTYHFKKDYVNSVFPNTAGNGLWYTTFGTSKLISHRSINHYDLRSAKVSYSIPMPDTINYFSINPSNTHLAVITTGTSIEIFNIGTLKREQMLTMNQDKANKAIFSDDTTLVYNTCNDDYQNQQLHACNLKSAGIAHCVMPAYLNRIDFHKNTGLIIGSSSPLSLEIYDFGFKHQ